MSSDPTKYNSVSRWKRAILEGMIINQVTAKSPYFKEF